jgi:serine/threonine protein kinase
MERLGDYRIETELGRGGMAVVFRAVDERSGGVVALKLLYDHMADDDNMLKRFWREAQVAQRLQHQNIVGIIDYGEIDDYAYLTMPYMPGGSLARYFQKPQQVSLKTTARLLRQVAAALDYAHSQGVIHRDLKLENILLDEKKRPCLADFGIAHLADATRLTATGSIAGTPMYISPEQIRGKNDIDRRADVYSMAVMAYLMATGYHPFNGGDTIALLHQHLQTIPPIPSTVNAELPPQLDVVLMQGLAKDRDERHATAGEFAREFARAVGQLKTTTLVNITAPNPVPATEITEAVENSTPPGYRWLVGVVAVLVLLAAAGVFLLLFDEEPVEAAVTPDRDQAATQIVADITHTAEAVRVSPTIGGRATLPPSWTPESTQTLMPSPTMTLTPTITSTLSIPHGANASLRQETPLRTEPRLRAPTITRLPADTHMKLLRRNTPGTWVAVETFTEPQVRGWLPVTSIVTDVRIRDLDVAADAVEAMATPVPPPSTNDRP